MMVISLLGILKSGGAYLPLDPDLPTQRLEYMLEDSQVKVVITTSKLKLHLPEHNAKELLLDANWSNIAQQRAELPDSGARPDNLAYLLYTSGSTGRPKGVMGRHLTLTNRILGEVDPEKQDYIYIHKTTLNFIDSLWELFMPLISGAQLYIPRPRIEYSPIDLLGELSRRSVTHIVLVPVLLEALLDTARANSIKLPSLCYCACSGEVLSFDLVKRFKSYFPTTKLTNIYGTTEFWDATLYHAQADEAKNVPIGRPLPNMRAYILTDRLQPVPLGVTGELTIAGDGLARGYLNKQELTAQRFFTCPFDHGDERLYRTGDLARWRLDGNLEILGRKDRQVKVRGFRVELNEIELALRQYHRIAHAIVVHHKTETIGSRLIAYVVQRDRSEFETSSPLSASELRAHMKRVLPGYMIPEVCYQLETLPLTVSGKIDYNVLPIPEKQVVEYEPHGQPRNRIESVLVSIWERCLGINQIGVHDSFFDMGGNSITAIKVINLIDKELQIRASIYSIFDHQTISELAFDLESRHNIERFHTVVPISRKGSLRPLFCIHGGTGVGTVYNRLIRPLGFQYQIFSMQYPGLDGSVKGYLSLRALAAEYVQQVQTIQACGPYKLIGWSFGGLIAFEMACQLQAMGETIELLCMLDLRYRLEAECAEKLSDQEALEYLLNCHGWVANNHVFGGKVSSQQVEKNYALEFLKREGVVPHWCDGNSLHSMIDAIKELMRLYTEFEPCRFSGDVAYIATSRTAFDLQTVLNSWGEVIDGKIKLFTVDCEHRRMFDDEPAYEIGAIISSVLCKKDPQSRVTSSLSYF
jgi:amino acid adenylation domain-containing protein